MTDPDSRQRELRAAQRVGFSRSTAKMGPFRPDLARSGQKPDIEQGRVVNRSDRRSAHRQTARTLGRIRSLATNPAQPCDALGGGPPGGIGRTRLAPADATAQGRAGRSALRRFQRSGRRPSMLTPRAEKNCRYGPLQPCPVGRFSHPRSGRNMGVSETDPLPDPVRNRWPNMLTLAC